MAKYQVKLGTIQLPKSYLKKVRLTDQSYDNDFLWPGDLIPEDMGMDEAETRTLLAQGIIEEVSEATKERIEAGAKIGYRGKWSVDPTILKDKTFEDMQVMLQEIGGLDFDQSHIRDRGQAVAQLTKDWDPNFREDLAMAPTALELLPLPDKTGDVGSSGQHSSARLNEGMPKQMRAHSEAKLAELQARAQQEPKQEG